MWERGARHYPLSFRYALYMDNRPILPQDNTQSWFGMRKVHDPYQLMYFIFKEGQSNKILLSNNIPVRDRERMKEFLRYYNVFLGNMKYLAIVPAIFLSKALFSLGPMPKKLYYVGAFFGVYYVCRKALNSYFGFFATNYLSYYYYKYSHIAVDDLNKVDDPRRKFFQLDKSSYYRQTPQEIHDGMDPSAHHDTSIYYGPHPYDDHETLESMVELDKKFNTGSSKFDDPNYELVIGEKVDIKRRIRNLPTGEDYKKI